MLFAAGVIARGTYIPTDPKLAHRAPEPFPWPELLNNPYMTTPVVWYQVGKVKIWTDTRGVDFVRDDTKFDTFDECMDHCKRYSVVHNSPIDKPTDRKCNYYCTTYWDQVEKARY
ncbi:hypothetical protein PspLS_07012 [Pyricularia sp. CBS 133598]|nr:hypothetical protein PspLS_07012 [Pyricularia sp. CBS 133598]